MEVDGINIIQYHSMIPLEQQVVSADSEETRRREEGLEFLNDEGEQQTVNPILVKPVVKLQKKGTIEIFTFNITSVGKWGDLKEVIKDIFKSNGTEPQIMTFGGTLIQSAEDYGSLLKPGLHLIIYFAPTIEEVSQALNMLLFEDIPSTPSWRFESCNHMPPTPQNPISDESKLENYLKPPTPTSEKSYKARKYHLQPPNIHFNVPSPTPISVTLSNPTFGSIGYYNPEGKYLSPKSTEGLSDKYLYSNNQLDLGQIPVQTLNSNCSGILGAEDRHGDYTIVKDDSGLPTKPTGEINLPPWSPFQLYKTRVRNLQGSGGKFSPYRVVSGGIFPITSFDIYAQSQKKRVLCSMSWEVTASPPSKLVDLVSEKEMPCITWALRDHEDDRIGYRRTSEKRVYANYEGPTGLEDDREGQEVGWWMIEPERLPTEFTGEIGEHTFLLDGVAEVASHLNIFMQRCGISEEVIQGFVTYWTKNLELEETPMEISIYDEFINTLPDINPKISPRLILLRFLSPRDLRNLLPLAITPEPHRIVRLFAIFRVIVASELDAEGIDACADFESEVDRVLGGIGSCGGGLNCGHRGFNVAEVGGMRVFGK